ncbi:MAG TPA: chemotaxis protein CheA [Pyrinomonadaceae bacterium]|nr:chemotaxis protein CheA [Pyrinomonadaceae bacterium]
MADLNQPPDDFVNQFLDDYFAECEEHLATVRAGLLNLERFVDSSIADTAQLDELFRSFHTIKGISGMVGLSPAEQLAHEMEGYLRVLRQGEAQLSKEGFDALIEGTKLLEEVINAHKTHAPAPAIERTITVLSEVIARSDTSLKPTKRQAEQTHKTQDKKKWRFLFAPSQARSEAGININSVRARLQSIGEILSTTPLVHEGNVLFELIVATSASESELDALKELELTIEPIQPEEKTEPATPTSQTTSTSVRVDLVRLDQLMLLVGELIVTRARLEKNLKSIRTSIIPAQWRQLKEVNVAFGKQLRDLRNDVMRVRMVPIAEVFDRMRFVVRDISRETRKQVTLQLSGQETEIDKFLVERLMDPLLHLVRNSISHGIESEEQRIAAGKPAEGHIYLRATTAGELVVIEVGDDGCGIDVKSVAAQAPEIALWDDEGRIDFDRLLETISAPGFSTRDHADRASGRGVGMDVVARAIKDLDGALSVFTEAGKGTTFRIELPLTLAITDALIATADAQTFAIHRSSVQEVIEIEPDSIKVIENNEIILHRDEVLPLVRLSRVFNLKDKKEGSLHAFVIGTGNRATGLVVDKVLGLREVVVRSLSDPLTDVPGVGGATELGDGRPILILDVAEILNESRHVYASQQTH